jgi:NAD(P)-dependent dehydrogenase (short-subunit alcohol dehydrogenase family)
VNSLNNSVVIITGGTQGIGRAATEGAVRRGARVVFGGRNQQRGEEIERELRTLGGDVTFRDLDVTSPTSITDFVNGAVAIHGRIDGCINNAGVDSAGLLHEQTDDEFELVMNTNVRGVFQCMRAQISTMLGSGGGAIVNVGSVASVIGFQMLPIYAASKHAVWGLTRSAAASYASRNIRINMVAPAGTDTPMLRRSVGEDPGQLADTGAAAVPLGRWAKAEEVADVILWLLSDASRFVCGQSIGVDGAYSASLRYTPSS